MKDCYSKSNVSTNYLHKYGFNFYCTVDKLKSVFGEPCIEDNFQDEKVKFLWKLSYYELDFTISNSKYSHPIVESQQIIFKIDTRTEQQSKIIYTKLLNDNIIKPIN